VRDLSGQALARLDLSPDDGATEVMCQRAAEPAAGSALGTARFVSKWVDWLGDPSSPRLRGS
jgi:hypothetical protein